jgi:acyl-CoA reductase-like NAD-dependent aldehyde dehydrogenase
MQQHCNFIGGGWVAPTEGRYYTTRNPAHPADVLGEFPSSTAPDVTAAVAAADAASRAWADTPGPQRGALLFRFAQLLEEAKSDLGRIVTLEQGKALGEAVGEVGRAAAEARFMAGEACRICGQTFPSERAGFTCSTVLEPLGVVAAISPWNFPVVTPVRKIAPALACGNTVVFKPATLTPQSAVFLLQLMEKAGFPAGVVNLVMGPGAAAGEPLAGRRGASGADGLLPCDVQHGPSRATGECLISDPRVRGITFTGSTSIGLRIYEAAARRMARVQLELGGKNPAVVFDYEDLDGAAREIVAAAFLCSGQRCTALSRVIVCEAQADALVERILDHVSRIKVGDGLDSTTNMGPLVSKAQLETVEGYVRRGKQSGCALLAGGSALSQNPEREGYYYQATVFDHVAPDSALAQEEIFGPVLPVIRVKDADEAIAIANSTRYGLAAALFSSRMSIAGEFIRRVQAGMIHINHGTASQAHVPFGGVKDSGQGAYSIGPTAQEFFTNVKTVYIKW